MRSIRDVNNVEVEPAIFVRYINAMLVFARLFESRFIRGDETFSCV